MAKKTPKNKEEEKFEFSLEYLKDALKAVAAIAGIHPQTVTLKQLTSYDETITDWHLRPFGGLTGLKKNFPLTNKDLVEIKKQKEASSYIRNLEAQLADKQSLEKDIREALSLSAKPVKVKPYKPVKRKKSHKRDVVAMLNDTHIGLKVDPKEVDGLNEFNFEIASRRIGFFIDEVCDYKREKRDEVDNLHLLLNGDLIAGIIHGLQGNDLYMLTHQVNGAVHIFTNAIAHLAENFKNVKVYFSTGNHGDSPHRREGGRVLSQVYDSIEGQIFYAVSAAHKETKNVSFHAGHTLYQDFQLPAGRAACTHGHLMFSRALGNPGTTVNTKSLGTAISDFNQSQIRLGKEEIRLFLFGHTHCHFHITTKSGVQVYNAPSLSGIDSFAYSIGITNNLTGQVVFESTEKYMIGDVRLIHVNEADKNEMYDLIIPPYDMELVYSK
jgi:predicted phosphodiesterase